MADLNQLIVDYVKGGGMYPQTFARGFSDAGRFGVNGEGAGIPDAQRAAYAAGGQKRQEDRSTPIETPWIATQSQ